MARAPQAAEQDNKKKLIIIAAGILVLLLLIFLFATISKRKKMAAAQKASAARPNVGFRGQGGISRGAAPAAAPAATTAPGQMPGVMPSSGPAAGARAAVPTAAAPVVYPGDPEPIREDPFVLQKPPPKGPHVIYVPPPPPSLPAVPLSEGGIRVHGPPTPAATLRRTVGILWNGQVYGLLQLGNSIYVVRPGDTVSEYTVSAITRDSIVLYSQTLGKQIQVPLQGPRSQLPEEVGPPPVTELPGLETQPTGSSGGQAEQPQPLREKEEAVPALPEFPPE